MLIIVVHVSVRRNMSSAKRRLLKYSPSILFGKCEFCRNELMPFYVGGLPSSCLCWCISAVRHNNNSIAVFCPLFLKRIQHCLTFRWADSLLVVDERCWKPNLGPSTFSRVWIRVCLWWMSTSILLKAEYQYDFIFTSTSESTKTLRKM